MPKIRSPNKASSASTNGTSRNGGPASEETTGLMTNAVLGANSQFKLPVALAARWQRVVAAVVVGCLLLFVWESLEVDQTSGDVTLKLHSGRKQDDGNESFVKPTGKQTTYLPS